jgi:hypothetical protein
MWSFGGIIPTFVVVVLAMESLIHVLLSSERTGQSQTTVSVKSATMIMKQVAVLKLCLLQHLNLNKFDPAQALWMVLTGRRTPANVQQR